MRPVATFLTLGLVLTGCASSYTSNIADGFDPSNIGKRHIVLFRNSHLLANTAMASNAFKSFEKDGITAKEFDHRFDSIFFRAVKGDAKMAGLRIDTTTSCDSLRSLPLAKNQGVLRSILPKQFPNDSDLYLAVGMVTFDIDGQFNPGGGPIFLRARSTFVLYDPKLGTSVADGQISVVSSSLLGHMITQGDWYADARQTGEELISKLIEFR
jgi:hypothetical protein